MKKSIFSRRTFVKNTALSTLAFSFIGPESVSAKSVAAGKRVGIIGLDTSHSTAFVKALNASDASTDFWGIK